MHSIGRRRWATALIAGLDATALIAMRHAPANALAALGRLERSSDAADADRVAATLCAAGLFLVALWLGLGLGATAVASLPGVTGRVAGRLSRVLLPALIRRVLAGSAGLGVMLAPMAATAGTPAAHPAGHRASTSVSTSASTPANTPANTMPTPTWPTTSHRRSAPPASGAPPRADVRVTAGESLWLIAAQRLGAHTTDADIAHYWPRIYAHNSAVIGDDPALIKPGQRLTLPDPTVEELPS